MATRIASARPAAFRFLRSSTSRGLSSPRAAHHRTLSASMDSAPVPAADELAFGPWMIKRSEVFKATTKTFAFVNIRPLVPGHVLVSPVRIVPRFSDLNPDEVADMWTTAHEVGKKLEPHYGASSMTYAIQDGPAAGQTVPHVHIHILPRMAGDFEKNDEVYDAIEGNEGDIKEALAEGSGARQGTQKLDLDIERKNRSAEEMAEEARTLAALFT
uniref:HIT domain-containing protein n=1 Tax=Tetraselmis chuii TaxID=63592 RepID=A0A7S1SP94_9CHLO